jgi:uncharacterized delta-60 repeat protein
MRYSFCAILLLSAVPVAAQAGSLDVTWAPESPIGAGKVTTRIGGSNDSARAIAVQSDGKVLVTGSCYTTNYELCVVRYNANGSLDSGWNGNGAVITPISNFEDGASAIIQQPDGKIVVAGTCYNGYRVFCAVRYNSNGSLDTGWNGTGRVLTSIGGRSSSATATAVALQPDGKVLLAGYCRTASNNDFCSARYHTDGTLDTSWNGTGKAVTPIGRSTDDAHAMALQRDGKVLLAGQCFNGTQNVFCILRYLTDGSLDTSWNATGSVMTPIGSFGSANAIALQGDDKVIVAGECWSGAIGAFCTQRYQSDGTLDTTWNATGKTITPIGTGGVAHDVVVQPDGKLIVAGECFNAATVDFCMIRYNADGTLDTGWGSANPSTAGKVIIPIGSSHDQAFAAILQPDAKLLLAGSCLNTANDPQFCVARLLIDDPVPPTCAVDLDGDMQVYATTDSLMHVRIALGLADAAVTNGIAFPAGATRVTWSAISAYLVGRTLDIDGDQIADAGTDSIIHVRVALGLTGEDVVAGLTFRDNATRKTWPRLHAYLVNECEMMLPPPLHLAR